MTDKVSDEAKADDAAGEEENQEAPASRAGCLGSFLPSTTPGCAAWLVAVFLICTVVTVWLVFWLDPDNVPWRYTLSWWRITAIIGLTICIPWIVYKTTDLWMKGVPGIYPDLDYAWRAGLHALEANELSIEAVPIFLITGSSSETQEKAIMNASGMSFSIEGVPQGPAPIHWYANSEAIYIFCSDCSWSSALASLREELSQEAFAAGISAESPTPRTFNSPAITVEPVSNVTSTFQPEALPQSTVESQRPATTTPGNSSSNYRGTVVWNEDSNNQFTSPSPTSATSVGTSSGGSSSTPYRGTLILGDGSTASSAVTPASVQPATTFNETWSAPASPSLSEPKSPHKPVLVSHQYASACLQELQYLGQLIRNARQPLCPINGCLSLIQFESIHSTQAELDELQKALRADMETIQYAFQLRAPVSTLIVGLEKERGFRELVLRVGRDRAMNQRFGRRFDVHALPTKGELQALAIHLCGVFEDWAYSLFREEQSLMRPGNTRLYELLSKVRCEWKMRLTDILTGGYGCEPGKANEATSNLFSGCYFAATGESADRQAFVKGVFDKLAEEQELIEWTSEARRSNQWQSLAANLGMIVTLALAITLAILYLFFER